MNKNQYVNSILKRLLATDRTKKRIRADLMTEIEALEDQGFKFILAQLIEAKAFRHSWRWMPSRVRRFRSGAHGIQRGL